MERPQCEKCKKQPATVNYRYKGRVYYRKTCYSCIKKERQEQALPRQLLKKSGYKKKSVCDRCGFVSKTPEQIKIHYKDQNPFNVSLNNLRSYCINCVIEIKSNPDADKRTILPDY